VAGGSIEVYPSVEDANKRNDDLTAIDTAEPIKTGSHTVVGTMVVRTSNLLTEEQQKDLETRIIWELTKLEE
jgi:hypothetical protein